MSRTSKSRRASKIHGAAPAVALRGRCSVRHGPSTMHRGHSDGEAQRWRGMRSPCSWWQERTGGLRLKRNGRATRVAAVAVRGWRAAHYSGMVARPASTGNDPPWSLRAVAAEARASLPEKKLPILLKLRSTTTHHICVKSTLSTIEVGKYHRKP